MKQVPLDYEPVRRTGSSTMRSGADAFNRQVMIAASEKAIVPTPPAVSVDQKNRIWSTVRGHLVSYLGLFLFTTVVYFRPYELFPSLRRASTMAFWIAVFTLISFCVTQLSIEQRLTAPLREVKLALLLGLAALLSVPLADDVSLAWAAFTDFSKIIIMFVVMVNVVRTRWRLQGLLFLVLAVSCYLSISAFSDYLSGTMTIEGYRVRGAIRNMFQNPNDLALHLVTIVPIALGLLLSSRSLVLKILYGLCALMFVGAIALTYSRAGFLGLMIVIGFLAWRLGRRSRILTYGALVIALFLFVAFAPGGYGKRVAGIFGNDGSTIARQDDLKRSIIVMLRHPVFGVGMSNYILRSNNNTATHNAYTQVGADIGLAGMIIYIMFVITPFRRLRQIERETTNLGRRHNRYYYLAVGLQASVLGYMASSFFASVAYLWNIYYLVAYAVCLHVMYIRSMEGNEAENHKLPVAVPRN